jgi:hypothetical protein
MIVTIIDPTILAWNDAISVCQLTSDNTVTPHIPGGGWTGTNVTSGGVFTPSTVGIFTLNYEVGGGSCYQTGDVVVTVTALPTITFTPMSDEICIGESSTLIVGGDGISYEWTPAVILSTMTGTTVVVTPTLTTTY